jgi:hypothetical protein
LIADEDYDLNLLDALKLNADAFKTNQSAANELLVPAHVVQAQAIDVALDSVYARRLFRPLRVAW